MVSVQLVNLSSKEDQSLKPAKLVADSFTKDASMINGTTANPLITSLNFAVPLSPQDAPLTPHPILQTVNQTLY